MLSKSTALLSVVLFMMFLVIGCENPNDPISTQDQVSTLSDAATLAKGKNNKNGNNERSCQNRRHSDRDHGNNGVCNDDDDDGDDDNCNNNNNGTCDSDGIETLWAGKTTNAGTVTVTQGQNNLIITYTTSGSWKIRETHLDISTSAYTQRGAPGQYDYQSSHTIGITTYTYTIPITWASGTKIYVLAHAVVGKYSYSNCSFSETAFAGSVIKPRNGSWFATFCTTIKTTTPPPTYSINGIAFDDANSNGVFDIGEAGLANAVIGLSTGATATTNAGGQYTFGGLAAGSYTVTGGAVSGYNQTTSASVAVTITTANGSANFGYAVLPPLFVISGQAYFDTNSNGIQDTGELGLPNIPISISGGESKTTDANGFYSFSGLPPGTYSIIPGLFPGLNVTSNPMATVTISTADGSASFGYNDTPVPLRVAASKPKHP